MQKKNVNYDYFFFYDYDHYATTEKKVDAIHLLLLATLQLSSPPIQLQLTLISTQKKRIDSSSRVKVLFRA